MKKNENIKRQHNEKVCTISSVHNRFEEICILFNESIDFSSLGEKPCKYNVDISFSNPKGEEVLCLINNEIRFCLRKELVNISNANAVTSNETLIIEHKGRIQLLKYKEILFMERSQRNTYFFSINHKYCSKKNLDVLNTSLPNNFLRCHHSFIINLDYVIEYKRTGFKLLGEKTIPISRAYEKKAKQAFLALIKDKTIV